MEHCPAVRESHAMLHGKRSSGRRKRKITCQDKRAFDSFSGIVIYLDILWLCDEPLEDTADLPDLDLIAEEMLADLEAALEQLQMIAADFWRIMVATNLISGEIKVMYLNNTDKSEAWPMRADDR